MMHLKLVSVAIAASLFAGSASAQVFKCSYVDKSSRQTKTVYTDEPCTKTGKQTLTEYKLKPLQTTQIAAKNNQQNQSPTSKAESQASSEALDNAVTQAVLNKNFELAKSLAVTKEHWRLIAVANQPAPAKPAVEAVEERQVAAINPCGDATEAFDYESRVNWRDKDAIAAKKSIMYAACGINEPNPQIIVGQNYGYYPYGTTVYGYPHTGITTTRWVPPVVYPQHDRRHHHDNRNGNRNNNGNGFGGVDTANSHHYGEQINHSQNNHHGSRVGEGLSVNINSGRFGLQVGGYSQHSSRYSQSTTVFVTGQ
jgi:hypothetical protein